MKGAKETILRNKPFIAFEIETQCVPNFNDTFQHYKDFIEEIGYQFLGDPIGLGNYFIIPKDSV